ncbi:MAG: thiamine pyrophosphate-binding protein [Promethearchaeota archaeon]|nr:MAG: thiamine pyrophosphate-binding protein [Candidatus Lokiarchaeota archaeon]
MESENQKQIIHTGHGMARLLKEHGVEHVFGIPDGHTLGLYDGILATDGIEHVLFNDERSACFAADAYSRVTGMLGVCDAGAAGSMNFPVALAEAKGAASSVLAIIGVIKSTEELRNIPHDIKVAETLTPVTKWTGKVLAPEYLPRFMAYAIKQAVNGRPGPVALVISEDVISSSELKLKEFIPRVKGSCSINSCRIAPPSDEIEQAVEMVRYAKQPAIYSGGGAILSGAFQEVKELSNLLKAPVFSTISGKGIMTQENNDPNNMYFGTVGLFGEKPNHKFIRTKSDLLIVIGNRLTEDDTANFKVPTQRMEMIQIDIDPAEIGLNYQPWGVVGDPKASLIEILRILHERGISDSNNEQDIIKERKKNIEKLRSDHNNYRESDTANWIKSEPIKPQRVLKAISESFTKNDYLITDASASSRWIGPYFPVKSIGRKIITPRGVGPTGFGVGALIGTSIAANAYDFENLTPKFVLFTGDGGLMNGGINEFETIQKLDLNCTIVIINNSSLGFVKFGQAMLYKHRYYDTDRPNTNFAKIAEAFGGNGIRVERISQLDSAVKDAINMDGFNLVDVIVDPIELLPPNFY